MMKNNFDNLAIGMIRELRDNQGKSWEEVNLVSAALAGVTNAGLALVGRGYSKADSMNNLKGLDKILYGTMTNSPLLGL